MDRIKCPTCGGCGESWDNIPDEQPSEVDGPPSPDVCWRCDGAGFLRCTQHDAPAVVMHGSRPFCRRCDVKLIAGTHRTPYAEPAR